MPYSGVRCCWHLRASANRRSHVAGHCGCRDLANRGWRKDRCGTQSAVAAALLSAAQVFGGLNSDLIRLGRILYFEPLLSRTGTISCNTCHPLAQYGVTHARFSVGVDGKLGRRNAPSVYNSAGHFRQFWDGRAANLTEQALGPIGSATEMGMDEAAVKQVLTTIPSYRELFARAFPLDAEPVRVGNVAVAIAEFERGLVTPARWDRYLEGIRRH